MFALAYFVAMSVYTLITLTFVLGAAHIARKRGLGWRGILLAALGGFALATSPVSYLWVKDKLYPILNPSPHEWKSFVKTEGHANEIPASWVETPAGKFAHDIKIPNPVPADSGYKWHMSSKEYFDHLCEKESGSSVFKTIENVDGFVMLRAPRGNTEEQNNDRWWLEAPGMTGRKSHQYNASWDASAYVDPPHNTFQYVEFPTLDETSFLSFAGKLNGLGKWKTVETREVPNSRFAVTWRGIHRQRDRQHSIAGYEWIILDRETNEVIAVLRNFNQTGLTRNYKEGIYWMTSRTCPSMYRVSGKLSQLFAEEMDWIPRVLKPRTYPKSLEIIEKLIKRQEAQELEYQEYLKLRNKQK